MATLASKIPTHVDRAGGVLGHRRPDCVGGSYVCARRMQKPRVAAVTRADGHRRWNCVVLGGGTAVVRREA